MPPTLLKRLKKLDLYLYDCILLDLMLPGGDGIKLLEELKNVEGTIGRYYYFRKRLG